jgi:hypothetical protein
MSELQDIPKLDLPQSEDQQKEKDRQQKSIDRLVNLYMHQNTLLWSRLQALTALQIPVLGGWYFFWSNQPQPQWLACAVAILGALLSLAILELTNCDASRRKYLRDSIEPIDKAEYYRLFPEHHDRRLFGKIAMWLFGKKGIPLSGKRVMKIVVVSFFGH